MSTIGSSPALLRRMNSRAVLAELFRAGPDVGDPGRASRTVTELVAAVGLTRPTVEAALTDLVAEGWVEELKAVATPNRAGRRARRFRIDARSGLVLGIDLGLHAVVGVLADLHGDPVARTEQFAPTLAPVEQAVDAVREVVDRLVGTLPPGRLLAVTVCVPAIIDRAGRIVHSVAAPEWQSGGITDRIAALVPDAVTVFENDAKAAARAEAAWGRLHGVRDGLLLVMGRQIGAALVVGGTVAQGAHGAAGEVGGIAATGWPAAARALEARTGSGADLPSAAGDGRAAVRALAADVAPGVAQLVAAVDPEVVVVGGEVLPDGEEFCTALARELERTPGLGLPGAAGVSVVPSGLGRDAVSRGAVARSLATARAERLGLGAELRTGVV
ncbi:ROK family protein [Curtobacterium sp. CFBP9011]|uniref:ROK family protein n=1 Tax=Curtobacterium sp. CFBP9011 TaxID=3096530 RepID=UPI002A6AD5B2|nr:ROK family protein [Curtobacterium sp. CFBP9011]MDY1005480.1 ROK family protein [Curtobacterium sp. CFBP9011]